MTSSILNIDLPSAALDDAYSADYYWYLKSPEFHAACLRPIGDIVNASAGACLDVGCGEGQLSAHIDPGVVYTGIDASPVAVAAARGRYPDRHFIVGRFEEFECDSVFRTVVFGGILEVLVKPEMRVPLLERYLAMVHPARFIIYDLERLDTSEIEKRFRLVAERHVTVDLDRLEEAKRHRKSMVFEC